MLMGILAVLIAYLLGSFPSAYLMTRWRKGIDIRDVDVHNMGGGAVIRVVGLPEGIIVLLCDGGKGAAAVAIAMAMGVDYFWVLAAAFAAFLGHNFPVYVGFRGGKGIASILGMFLVLAPQATLITLCIIGLILLYTRHFFSAIAIAAPFFLLSIYFLGSNADITYFSGSLAGSNMYLIYYYLWLVAFSFISSRRRLHEVKAMSVRGALKLRQLFGGSEQ